MNWDEAIDMLEKGESRMVALTAVVLASGGKVWLSFDGNEWEETESKLIINQLK